MAAAQDLALWLQSRGVTTGADLDSAGTIRAHATDPHDFGNCELVVTLGGDGTLIKAADWCSRLGTPILGVNFGRFGFVTQCAPEDAKRYVQLSLDGKAEIEERMMLRAELLRNNQAVATLHALNEAVIHRTVASGMVVIKVTVDGHAITAYPADGVLVSTSTGSTAYNLSAGGPLLDPMVRALVLTAIAPHTLSARPLVLRPEARISFEVESNGDAVLSADGKMQLHLLTGDVVKVSRSERTTRLVRATSQDFLEKLSEKLLWSHRSHPGGTE